MNDSPIIIAFASETGFVEEIAEDTEDDLESLGVPVQLLDLGQVDRGVLERARAVLFMTSTTGDGDPPWTATRFADDLMAEPYELGHLRYGLLAAGDQSYPTFCGFGRRLGQWLQASGAEPLFADVYVDAEDENCIDEWRERVLDAFGEPSASARASGTGAAS